MGYGRLTRRARAVAVAGVFGVGTLAAGTGVAMAVSGGGFSPSQQDCSVNSSSYATPQGKTEKGCHNLAVNVESGGTSQGDPNSNNTRYFEWGDNEAPIDNNAQGTPGILSIGDPGTTTNPHSGCFAANTDGTGGGQGKGCGSNKGGAGFEMNYDYYQVYCPLAAAAGQPCEDANPGTTTFTPETGTGVDYQQILENGVLIYFGMDDNIDNGEHDGLGYGTPSNDRRAVNGPSDGGGAVVSFTPQSATNTPSATNPEGLANASMGFCADGICGEGTTQQQTVYHGCGTATPYGTAQCDKGTPQNANVYDYAPGGNPGNDPSVNSESPGCNSGDPTTTSAKNCGAGGMNAWRSATPSNENAEPGVQTYADPDSQRSPAAPAPFWPTPGTYVGTCGVYAGSPGTTGQVIPAGTPETNAAGQIAVDDTLCG